MTFDELVSAFAARYAVEGLSAEDGAAALSVDGTQVSLRESADGAAVVLAADIGEMPPDAAGAFAAVALQANYAAAGGTALSLDDEAGELFATSSLPLALADPEALSRAVEDLVDTAAEWSRLATAFLDVDEEAALSRADDENARPLSGVPDFIRV